MKVHQSKEAHSKGQTTSETILVLPLFLVIAFGVLQLGQLGIALIMVNTAASKIARRAVQDNAAYSTVNSYTNLLTSYMTAGMKQGTIWGCLLENSMTPTIQVNATARVDAFPFVGWLLKPALQTSYNGNGMQGCSGEPPSLGPFYFSGSPPYYFIVRGRSTVRMNYHPCPQGQKC
jgi:Flp pilus assembly protein TadG